LLIILSTIFPGIIGDESSFNNPESALLNIGYEGNYPNGFSPWQALMTYNHILCLIEAAYRLDIDQQMQSVTDVLSRETAEAVETD
jgi:hypothetical protein